MYTREELSKYSLEKLVKIASEVSPTERELIQLRDSICKQLGSDDPMQGKVAKIINKQISIRFK